MAVMSSYNRYNQRAYGRRVWPFPDYPIQLDTFDSGWWVANGFNWAVSGNKHNELRVGLQHSGDTNRRGREAEHFELNGIVNGLPARFALPLGLVALSGDNAPVIGKHYITTISDTFTWLQGDHTWSFGGNYRDTQWRDCALPVPARRYLGLPRYSIGSPPAIQCRGIFNATSNARRAEQRPRERAGASTRSSRDGDAQVQTGAVVDPNTLQYSELGVLSENWTSAGSQCIRQDRWRIKPNLTLNCFR